MACVYQNDRWNSNDVITLALDTSTSVTVHLFGATVISWVSNGIDNLFLSEKAIFDNKKAIRGGIPVVFPNFGPWECGPQHGFARTTRWMLHTSPQLLDGDKMVTELKLEDSAETRAMWNHKFCLLYRIELSVTSLRCQLTVESQDSEPFDFTCLLHSYFRLASIADTTVSGLQGLAYVDKVKKGTFVEGQENIAVNESVDRIYQASPDQHTICVKGDRTLILTKENLPDTVLWNPWAENARAMADFGDDEYNRMVCVEPGHVSSRVCLQPGTSFTCAQIITVAASGC